MEAKRKDITPFCLTVDKTGHDYLKTMCGDMSYEVRGDILDAAQHDIRDVPGLLLTLRNFALLASVGLAVENGA
jgi:hypothetical protein